MFPLDSILERDKPSQHCITLFLLRWTSDINLRYRICAGLLSHLFPFALTTIVINNLPTIAYVSFVFSHSQLFSYSDSV
jgi:hypothetical protein